MSDPEYYQTLDMMFDAFEGLAKSLIATADAVPSERALAKSLIATADPVPARRAATSACTGKPRSSKRRLLAADGLGRSFRELRYLCALDPEQLLLPMHS